MAPHLGSRSNKLYRTAINYLLEYAGVRYFNRSYKTLLKDDSNGSDTNEKFDLGLDFLELPFYIDGDIRVTGELPILRHVAREHGLDGKTLSEQARLDVLVTNINDYNKFWTQSEANNKIHEYIQELPRTMKLLTDFMGNNKFAVGEYVTYADFVLFEYLQFNFSLLRGSLREYSVLAQYYVRVASLESMVNYFRSPNYKL